MTTGRPGITDLPWLPRVGDDFRQRLSDLDTAGDWGSAARALAGHALNLNQSVALAKRVRRLRESGEPKGLAPFRLGLASNATTDFVVPCLEACALRHGLVLDVIQGAFDQATQDALNPASALNTSRPDAVLLALDHRGLAMRDEAAASWPPFRAEPALKQIDTLRESLRRHSGAPCLVQTVPVPPAPLFGSLDAGVPGTLRAALMEFNRELAQRLGTSGDVLLDIDLLAQTVGLAEWFDERDWAIARMPFAQRALALYADTVMRTIAALRGKARKCLVLDLDNTLWGGVIGDDGLDGISLHQGDPRGEAHRAVQAAALDLRRRGVVLAVCSKNDDAVAREPFRSHPAMLLKEEHIAVFLANWDDKASNLERIAERLDIGIDALVLLDDNPVERAQVRQALPLVAVPEIGADPSSYVRTLLAAGYFESVAFTPEDLQRAEQYQGNARRSEVEAGSRDLGEFLRSLEMQIHFEPFNALGRKRITQLINKTNQFNLTTRRYSEPQVAELEQSGRHFTLQARLADRFGDNGMICVVICERGLAEWTIDSWLMSCRVLNRMVEQSVCNHLAAAARAAQAQRLVGRYRPTERNGMVADLYARLGFTRLADDGQTQCWALDLQAFVDFEVPMLVHVAPA